MATDVIRTGPSVSLRSTQTTMRLAAVGVVLVASALSSACDRKDEHLEQIGGGRADRGQLAIRRYGCGSCHAIPGISGANGLVGPPLAGIASRVYVGGVVTNTPDHMIEWLEDPRSLSPKTAMPNLGVTHGDAANIASYLYTLK
jgi:cytochrome c2